MVWFKFNIFINQCKINLTIYLYNFALGLNEGIEGIKKISEDFEKSYQKCNEQ